MPPSKDIRESVIMKWFGERDYPMCVAEKLGIAKCSAKRDVKANDACNTTGSSFQLVAVHQTIILLENANARRVRRWRIPLALVAEMAAVTVIMRFVNMKDQDEFKGMKPFQILLRTKKWILHLTMTLIVFGNLLIFGIMIFYADAYQNPTPKNTIGPWQFWGVITSLVICLFALWAAIGSLLKIYADNASRKVERVVARGSEELNLIEGELATSDKSGLVPLLRYSRVQLEAYYRMGLTQTQRSFRHSVIAMWIGFAVIVGGLVVHIIDLSKFGLIQPAGNLGALVIASGLIIEVISGLFLWVYRASIKQLTYFYNRQMYNHSVLMSQRIAETMSSSDDIKKTIVEKLLDRSWALDLDALPSGKQLLSGTQRSTKA